MNDRDAALREQLPPEKLLATSDIERIRAGIACMDRVETVQQYIGYENAHRQRVAIIELLALRVQTLRQQAIESSSDSAVND